jgi:hypothetical protein
MATMLSEVQTIGTVRLSLALLDVVPASGAARYVLLGKNDRLSGLSY